MIDGQREQSESIKKAMKFNEIVVSDKNDFIECKNDLMKKLAMDESDAEEVAHSIREKFLPKVFEAEGLKVEGLPLDDNDVEMTENDENFADDSNEEHEYKNEDQDEDSEFDAFNDGSEVDENEIATIQLRVPVDKIGVVQKALEDALGDTDAQSKDHAMVHDINEQGDNMDNKEIEARKELRKTILAAMADDEIQTVSRTNKFDYDESEQYDEEDKHPTVKGDITDPDFATLDYNDHPIPTVIDDLGLDESMKAVKFDGAPENREEYSLDFDVMEIPSQGDKELYTDAPFPSEGDLQRKRTVNSSTLGSFDSDAAEELLADALRSAGVVDEDLAKLTYAEGLELYKAIRTASKVEDRDSYSPNGVMDFPQNVEIKDPDKESTVDEVKEEDTTEERKELYSSSEASNADGESYAAMLKKLVQGEDSESRKSDVIVDTPKVDINASEEAKKAAETALFKARLKTAFSVSNKLVTAGLLPASEVDSYAEGLLEDNLTVQAMIRQTSLMINNAAANAERLASNDSIQSVRKVTAGISFNPSVNSNVDLSGSVDVQDAIKYLWKYKSEVEE
jgi:hypothetical protein